MNTLGNALADLGAAFKDACRMVGPFIVVLIFGLAIYVLFG